MEKKKLDIYQGNKADNPAQKTKRRADGIAAILSSIFGGNGGVKVDVAGIVSAANNKSNTTTTNQNISEHREISVNNKSMMLTAAILGGVAIIIVLVIRLTK